MSSTETGQSPSPSDVVYPSKPPPRKRQLTQAEKANIQGFYQKNPNMTHVHIARLFGLERSTVTKVLGQPQIEPSMPQAIPDQQAYNSGPNAMAQLGGSNVDITPQSVVPSKVQRALFQWAQHNQQAGIRVTNSMLRQEAAGLSAMTWTARRPSNGSGQAHLRPGAGTSPTYSIMSTDWNNTWKPSTMAFSPSISPSRNSYFPTSPADSTRNASITMNDVISACDQTNQSLLEAGPFDVSISLPSEPPTVDEAHGALSTLREYLKQGGLLSPFDYLCLEHFQERVLELQTGLQGNSIQDD